MTWYNAMLFIHLVTVAGAFYAVGLMMSAVARLPACRTVAGAERALATAASIGKLMPVVTLLLLVTGGVMTQTRWSWGTGWIDASIFGLLLVTAIGAGYVGSRERLLHRRLSERPKEERIAQVDDVPITLASGVNVGIIVGVMFVMVMKPPMLGALIALAAGAAIGYAVLAVCVRARRRYEAVEEIVAAPARQEGIAAP